MPRYSAPIEAGIISPNGSPAPFTVSLFGINLRALMTVPGGGWPIRHALGKLAEEGYTSSPFAIVDNRGS